VNGGVVGHRDAGCEEASVGEVGEADGEGDLRGKGGR